MAKSAIIIGATGLTGSLLLKRLLEDDRYEKVKLFSRSSCGIEHLKIEEHLIDLFELEKYAEDFKADEVYCCIGTTKKKTPDRDIYKKIDLGIPVSAAKLCQQNQIDTFAVISSMGANSKSSIFYTRTKGEMEEAILAAGLSKTYVLRPSLITGSRNEKRAGEKFAAGMMAVMRPLMIFGLKKHRSIKADDIAKAMIVLANNNHESGIILSDKIQELADGK